MVSLYSLAMYIYNVTAVNYVFEYFSLCFVENAAEKLILLNINIPHVLEFNEKLVYFQSMQKIWIIILFL